jgi:hypothetical protein
MRLTQRSFRTKRQQQLEQQTKNDRHMSNPERQSELDTSLNSESDDAPDSPQRVNIIQGKYQGLRGIVLDATPNKSGLQILVRVDSREGSKAVRY